MSFTDRANRVRHRIPFAYWLFYDAVLTPFLVWGLTLSWVFVAPLVLIGVSWFFDINEAIVKYGQAQ